MKRNGTIISFYSFKGGVGRTMSMVNIAILLARKHKVLIIDFDLEAPGLENFLADFQIQSGRNQGGLLDILEIASNNSINEFEDFSPFMQKITGHSIKSLQFINSGKIDRNYSNRVQQFNWSDFFLKSKGGEFFEYFREKLKNDFDYVFIDSRTGYSDTSGICTYLLPDVLVLLFSSNEQSLQGTIEVAEKAENGRQKLSFDRMPLTIFPVPARIDKTEEYLESKKWNLKFSAGFSKYYNNWLPKSISPERILEEITIPYVAYYSFGEKLPVLEDSLTKKESPAFYYSQIARIIENNFQDLVNVLGTGDLTNSDNSYSRLAEFLKAFPVKLNDRQFAIIEHVLKQKQVTNKWCRESFHVVNDTVNRDLNQLVEMRLLMREASGRATHYVAGELLNISL
jgi:MinD-like ATPase involved in chromosome partitioning or flagellar assembly